MENQTSIASSPKTRLRYDRGYDINTLFPARPKDYEQQVNVSGLPLTS